MDAVSTNTITKIKIGKYISGSFIKSIQTIELFFPIKFPKPAPIDDIMNTLGTMPIKVEKKYFFIFMSKITGKTF